MFILGSDCTHCFHFSAAKALASLFKNCPEYCFKSKPKELPLITILLDNGYHPETIRRELEKVYPELMTKIQFELSPKPSKVEKQALAKSGFVPVKARWVIERSNSWVERCKSLVKNFERSLENATTKLNLCFVRLMLKRLAIAAIE